MDHNKLIASAAKEALGPLGLKRQGKSRIWYDDHGWWSIVVEFQPSSWSRGTYLNVGVNWFLYEKSHWSFDVGYREESHTQARNEAQFTDATSRIAAHARESVEKYRALFMTIGGAHEYYRTAECKVCWEFYHAAIIAALNGDRAAAHARFDKLLSLPGSCHWQHGLYYRALELSRLLESPEHWFDSILGIVHRTRGMMLLEDSNLPNLGLPNAIAR